jgi:hypothetical protein
MLVGCRAVDRKPLVGPTDKMKPPTEVFDPPAHLSRSRSALQHDHDEKTRPSRGLWQDRAITTTNNKKLETIINFDTDSSSSCYVLHSKTIDTFDSYSAKTCTPEYSEVAFTDPSRPGVCSTFDPLIPYRIGGDVYGQKARNRGEKTRPSTPTSQQIASDLALPSTDCSSASKPSTDPQSAE